MPSKGKSICKKVGCNALIPKSGYCDDHQDQSKPFKVLDERKNPITKKFYSSGKWTKTSRNFRAMPINALCERCEERGYTQIAEEVHHEPPLLTLLKKGLNPHDHDYLHSLCSKCHGEIHTS